MYANAKVPVPELPLHSCSSVLVQLTWSNDWFINAEMSPQRPHWRKWKSQDVEEQGPRLGLKTTRSPAGWVFQMRDGIGELAVLSVKASTSKAAPLPTSRAFSLLPPCVRCGLTLLLPQPVKFPGWKIHGPACNQCILRSYNTSTFNPIHFAENPFTCQWEKEKKASGFQIWHFQWSFSSDILTVKGLRYWYTNRFGRMDEEDRSYLILNGTCVSTAVPFKQLRISVSTCPFQIQHIIFQNEGTASASQWATEHWAEVKESSEVTTDGNSSSEAEHVDLPLAVTRQFRLYCVPPRTCRTDGSDRLRFDRS